MSPQDSNCYILEHKERSEDAYLAVTSLLLPYLESLSSVMLQSQRNISATVQV